METPRSFSLALSLKHKKLHEWKVVLATQRNFTLMEKTPSYWNSATIKARGRISFGGQSLRPPAWTARAFETPICFGNSSAATPGLFWSADLWDLLVESFLKCTKRLGARGVIKLKSYNFSKEKAAEKEYTSTHVCIHIYSCSMQKVF